MKDSLGFNKYFIYKYINRELKLIEYKQVNLDKLTKENVTRLFKSGTGAYAVYSRGARLDKNEYYLEISTNIELSNNILTSVLESLYL